MRDDTSDADGSQDDIEELGGKDSPEASDQRDEGRAEDVAADDLDPE